MRKKLILVLIIFLYSISLAENSEKIVFKDLIFEEIIRDNAFKSEGDLYETDLETIKKLEVINYPEKKVTKIDEIELMKNLEILDIEAEYVKELSFLGSLKKVKTLFLRHPNVNIDSIKCLTELEEFSISTNNDFDIKLLENCKKIRKIELYFDKKSKKILKNIEVLQGFKNLTDVTIFYNKEIDLDFLMNISELKKLSLGYVEIKSIPVMDKLEEFSLSESKTTNGKFIENLKNINKLYLNDTFFNDLGVLSKLLMLKEFIFIDEKIILPLIDEEIRSIHKHNLNFDFLEKLKNIEKIEIVLGAGHQINVKTFAELPCLRELNLNTVSIQNFSGIENIKNLEVFSGKIDDVRDLTNCIKLEKLIIYGKQINNIDPLSKLINLKSFRLSGTQTENIKVLENMKKIEHLELDNNRIKNIEVLSKIENIASLNLENNEIVNFDSVRNLKELKYLNLGGNQIKNVEFLRDLDRIEDFNINRENLTDNSKKIIDRLMQKCKMKLKTKYIN